MRILQLTSHFSPNVGGVETHLDDLVTALTKRNHQVFVLTYRPLTTKTEWRVYETSRNLKILRIPWVPALFYKLVSLPALEFLYLLPGLLFITPFVLFYWQAEVIHAHGLVAGAAGVFWGKVFRKCVVISTHNVYEFPKTGFYRGFAHWIFGNADYVMGLSRQAAKEIQSLGVDKRKVGTFTYWIDLEKFKGQNSKIKNKEKVGWERRFVVLFVGRLIEVKGINELLKAAKKWDKNITLTIAGSGPMEEKVRNSSLEIRNLRFLGRIDQKDLPLYYSAADVLIVPSTHEEGFGRVILESLACGTPVIGSNRGAIPEAMNETVGKLIDVTPENIKDAVEYFYRNPKELEKISKNARKFAERRYSEKNVEAIIQAYRG